MKTKPMFFATVLMLMLLAVPQTFAQDIKIVKDPSKELFKILPDLIITDVTHVSTNVKQIKVQVKNQGTANAPASTMSLRYIPGNDSTGWNVPALAKGSSTWVPVTGTKSLYSQVAFMLRVDAPNAIKEKQEGNNTWFEDNWIK